jgi:polysaccharide export outer membrane protein
MEIGSTGTKTLFQEHVTIMEAIANAGDITITGDRKQLPLLESRQRVQMHDLDLTDINVMNSPYFFYSLMIIFILNHKQKTWGTGRRV